MNNEDMMTIGSDDFVAKLPEERQQAVKKRAEELIAEEATLRQIREAREGSQVEVAKKLHINQAGERPEQMEALRVSAEEMRAGKGIPAEEVLAEMRQILADAQKKKSR